MLLVALILQIRDLEQEPAIPTIELFIYIHILTDHAQYHESADT